MTDTLVRCCLSEHARSVNGHRYRSDTFLGIAEGGHGLYVGCSEPTRPADVSQRDQNVSHLRVFTGGAQVCLPAEPYSFKLSASFTTLESYPFAVQQSPAR